MKNLSPRAKQILSIYAQDEARLLGSKQILPEHVILAILKSKNGLGYEIFPKLLLQAAELQIFIEKFFETEPKTPTLETIYASRRYKQLIDVADIEASALHNNYIGTEHLILASIREEGSITNRFFTAADCSIIDARFIVMELQEQKNSSVLQDKNDIFVQNVFKTLMNETKQSFGKQEEKRNPKQVDKSKQQTKTPYLNEFCKDLTKLAKENKKDKVIGRDKEIKRIVQILSRRTKNNPVLVGSPGVGKTAIVEGLAQRIVSGNVPFDLLNKRIFSLDLASVVAGTKYRGEFEERMKKLLNELQENKDIIIFIDELHAIIGAGGNEGTMDASNIMKPSLSRGEIQIIGATTTKEYTKHIEKDLALERRFQVVKVCEPNILEAQEILEGVKEHYEKYHNVIYDKDVIPNVIKLSMRYIPEKVLPDKAIDILDEAGAAKKILEEEKPSELAELEQEKIKLEEEKYKLIQNQDYEKASIIRDKVIDLKNKLNLYTDLWEKNSINPTKLVTTNDIESIVSQMTGIPVEQMSENETLRIVHMEDELHDSVIGQNDAVNIISGAIRRSRAGISSPKHPLGSFIFLGPTGVGKTQVAKALAKYLFGSEDSLIRIDMSDYMEKHTASRLVGAPPGYIGYEEGGVLTEKVRHNPYSVVLLDEIEKAHPDIFNLLLQMLEEGELSDNLGHTVNFKNTVIIMTSNAGARQITNEGKVGFSNLGQNSVLSFEEIKSSATNELKKILSPELLNRIDDVIVFNTLTKKEVGQILDIQLKELSLRLQDKNLSIKIKPKAKEYLIEHGYNPSMGARPMRRLIRKEIEEPMALLILQNQNKEYNQVVIDCSKNQEELKLKLACKETVTIKKEVVRVR